MRGFSIEYDAIKDLIETLIRTKDKGTKPNVSRSRFKSLLLQKAREAVSGAPLAGGRTLHRRSGSLYYGLRVVDTPGGGIVLESTARNNGVNYGEVLNRGAVIYPRHAKALAFRVPSSATARTGFARGETALVFARKVTIPAFGWKDKAMQDAVSEIMKQGDVDLSFLFGGE